jgi:hypothetical protein
VAPPPDAYGGAGAEPVERALGEVEPAPDPPPSEPLVEWETLPDPEAGVRGDDGAGSGRYRGRRRLVTGTRAAKWGTAAVVAAVGVVLVGSGVLARSLSSPVTLPVLPSSPPASVSPSPVVVTSGPGVSQLGTAPTPTSSPTPSPPPAPPPAEPPPQPEPEPAPAPTSADPDDPPQPVTVSFEAEDAELSGGVVVQARSNASGGEVVDLRGGSPGFFVRFPDVTVDTAGDYQLILNYANDDSCCETVARVVVNDGSAVVVEFPPPPGNSIGSVSVTVALAAGDNTILVTANPDDSGPDLDRATITG